MKIRLTRKYSEHLNGIDLTHVREGDLLDLPVRDAEILVAEGWAVAERDQAHDGERRRRPVPRTNSKKRAKKKR